MALFIKIRGKFLSHSMETFTCKMQLSSFRFENCNKYMQKLNIAKERHENEWTGFSFTLIDFPFLFDGQQSVQEDVIQMNFK